MGWTVDGVAHSGAITTTWTDDTVDGGDTIADEIWECTATPTDGDDDGSAGTDSIVVGGASCGPSATQVSSTVYGAHTYVFCAGTALTFPEARDACASEGWHLANIDTYTVQTVVESLDTGTVTYFWFGAQEGSSSCNGDYNYCWYPWNSSSYSLSRGYRNWAPGEPSVPRGAGFMSASDGYWRAGSRVTDTMDGFVCQD